jgi:hypothetical protein
MTVVRAGPAVVTRLAARGTRPAFVRRSGAPAAELAATPIAGRAPVSRAVASVRCGITLAASVPSMRLASSARAAVTAGSRGTPTAAVVSAAELSAGRPIAATAGGGIAVGWTVPGTAGLAGRRIAA